MSITKRGKIDTSSKFLNSEELKELSLCVRDVFFFALFIFVVHPVRGKVRFDLYEYQKSVLYQFLKHRFNIILKFRQAGITELISMYCLWLAMYHPNKKINIISIKDTVAKKVLKKIKYMYKNLPRHLQTPIVNGRSGEYGTAEEIEFSNGSFIASIPTTEDAGRSEGLTLLVIDEAAIIRWASTIWASSFPTLSTGGSAIINSCITGDTEIIGRNGNFRVEQVCPKEFGVQDIRFMNLEVLTHKLQWKKALYGLNKGILETWEITNDRGDIIKCTPAHKFLTPKGWKSAKDIIEKGLYTINFETGSKGASDLQLVGYIKYLHLIGKDYDYIIRKVERRFSKLINRAYISRIVNNKRDKGVTLSKLNVLRKYSDTIYDITVEGDESYISNTTYVSHNTPYGMGNFYHSTWVDAVSGSSPLNPIRLFWNMHPERGIDWYNEMSSVLGPKRTAQEIDGDFLSSGNPVFDLTDIKAIEETLGEYPVLQSRFNGQYKRFNKPNKNHEYFIGADCSTGRSSDYSAFTNMNRQGEEASIFKGRVPLNKFSKILGDEGEKFNFACLAPETNDIGIAVTSYLQDEGYPNLYYSKKLLKKKGKRRPETELIPGWLTTTKNRSTIIEGLETDLRQDSIIVKDPYFVQEAYTFIYDGTGRPVAMGKHKRSSSVDIDLEGETYSDDSILGKAIANHVRKSSHTRVTASPV